jgi:hypothetical protein
MKYKQQQLRKSSDENWACLFPWVLVNEYKQMIFFCVHFYEHSVSLIPKCLDNYNIKLLISYVLLTLLMLRELSGVLAL